MTEAERERLIILAEECAEVQQAITKILRWGWTSHCPQTGIRNDEHLEAELSDLLCIIEKMEELGDIHLSTDLDEVWERKKKWMKHVL